MMRQRFAYLLAFRQDWCGALWNAFDQPDFPRDTDMGLERRECNKWIMQLAHSSVTTMSIAVKRHSTRQNRRFLLLSYTLVFA